MSKRRKSNISSPLDHLDPYPFQQALFNHQSPHLSFAKVLTVPGDVKTIKFSCKIAYLILAVPVATGRTAGHFD